MWGVQGVCVCAGRGGLRLQGEMSENFGDGLTLKGLRRDEGLHARLEEGGSATASAMQFVALSLVQ